MYVCMYISCSFRLLMGKTSFYLIVSKAGQKAVAILTAYGVFVCGDVHCITT